MFLLRGGAYGNKPVRREVINKAKQCEQEGRIKGDLFQLFQHDPYGRCRARYANAAVRLHGPEGNGERTARQARSGWRRGRPPMGMLGQRQLVRNA